MSDKTHFALVALLLRENGMHGLVNAKAPVAYAALPTPLCLRRFAYAAFPSPGDDRGSI